MKENWAEPIVAGLVFTSVFSVTLVGMMMNREKQQKGR